MTSSITNEEVGIRMCILSEFLHSNGKLSINEAYNNLCEEIGYDIIDLEDFHFWMNRFENRQFDLGYERKLEQKSKEFSAFPNKISRKIESNREEFSSETSEFEVLLDDIFINFAPKTKTFSDLPENVLIEIVQNLDLASRFMTRKVCKNLRIIVDKQPLELDNITINTIDKKVDVNFKNGTISHKNEDFSLEINGKRKIFSTLEHGKKIISDLKTLFENPKFKLNTFRIRLAPNTPYAPRLIETMKNSSKSSKIHVKNVTICCKDFETTRTILNFFQPGFLENIKLMEKLPNAKWEEPIMKVDQWKLAKSVDLGTSLFQPTSNLPNGFFHFEQFIIGINTLTKSQLIDWTNGLKRMEKFKKCQIIFMPELPLVQFQNLKKTLSMNGFLFDLSANAYRLISPFGTILDVKIERRGLRIEKIPSDLTPKSVESHTFKSVQTSSMRNERDYAILKMDLLRMAK